jgi:hypothetical protein
MGQIKRGHEIFPVSMLETLVLLFYTGKKREIGSQNVF